MIEIPVYDSLGKQIATVSVDEQLLGGELQPALLKQAYVRYHANRRSGSAKTKRRGENAYSTRKLYRQKGTGNARRGSMGTNLMRGGGHAFAKSAKSWRQGMPTKMRRLANRNALLAKVVDDEIKLIDSLAFDKPNTKQFNSLLQALKIDRSCLVALSDTNSHAARSACNLDNISLTHIDRLNVFDVLNHRYLLADSATFESYIQRITEHAATARQEVA
jgi:large subunit ribosomal protein L4